MEQRVQLCFNHAPRLSWPRDNGDDIFSSSSVSSVSTSSSSTSSAVPTVATAQPKVADDGKLYAELKMWALDYQLSLRLSAAGVPRCLRVVDIGEVYFFYPPGIDNRCDVVCNAVAAAAFQAGLDRAFLRADARPVFEVWRNNGRVRVSDDRIDCLTATGEKVDLNAGDYETHFHKRTWVPRAFKRPMWKGRTQLLITGEDDVPSITRVRCRVALAHTPIPLHDLYEDDDDD